MKREEWLYEVTNKNCDGCGKKLTKEEWKKGGKCSKCERRIYGKEGVS